MARPLDQSKAEETRLGSYEIVRKLARGGMAELFLARTTGTDGLEKLVVLKKILPNHAENPKFVRLFLDEAKLVSSLDHPHIAHVYDMGRVDAHYYFTMEYIHGQDVRSTLRRTSRLDKRFPIEHAVQIARNVASALHYAHERKRPDGSLLDIVHRDVSPSNILIAYDGTVKLVDFGVAKAATSTVKTRTGALKGKIAYMSPEQAKGSPIDRRSDIFSLGIVLWEMCTTQRLFRSDNDLATIQMIINSKAEAPSKHNPGISAELDRVVMKALANNLEERYQTAEQLQLDLEQLAQTAKLDQSTGAVAATMYQLFRPEIDAWTLAQANGETLIDYLLEPPGDLTTPVSESEVDFISEDDDVDYDEDIDSDQITALPSTTQAMATRQISVPPPPSLPTERLRVESQPLPPSVVVMDHTPLPHRADPSFPIAPKEWRNATEAEPELASDSPKKVLIAASVTFGVIVLIAAAFGGSPPSSNKPAAVPEPADKPHAILMPLVRTPPLAVDAAGSASD